MRDTMPTNWLPEPQQLQLPLPLPLPPRPGIRKADVCPKCKCMHTGYADAMACRTATGQREQM